MVERNVDLQEKKKKYKNNNIEIRIHVSIGSTSELIESLIFGSWSTFLCSLALNFIAEC